MDKYQEALDYMINCGKCTLGKQCKDCKINTECTFYLASRKLQELLDKAKKYDDKETPKKLNSKTDKDGRLLWVCPNCGDVYMKFWSDVETVSCRKHCDECGQALDWSDENDK